MYSFPYLEPISSSMSSSKCCFLTCTQITQDAGQVVWYSHLFKNFPQFIVIHAVKGFGIVNKVEVGVFLELSCFFFDPMDGGNLIYGPSAFSKSSLNMEVHSSCTIEPALKNFEHYFISVWDEYNCAVVEHSLALPFFGIGMKTDLLQSYYLFKKLIYLGLLTSWAQTISRTNNIHQIWYVSCFPGHASGKELTCQCRRHRRPGFQSLGRKIPWKRACNLHLYFCLENSIY